MRHVTLKKPRSEYRRPRPLISLIPCEGIILIGKNVMRRALVLWLLLCFAGAASAQGLTAFDGQYVGELTLAKVVDGDCTRPPLGALYPMTISGGEVRFAYAPRFNTLLIGRIEKDGKFTASFRLRRGVIRMTGRIEGNNVTAYIVSPSCNYRFQSKR